MFTAVLIHDSCTLETMYMSFTSTMGKQTGVHPCDGRVHSERNGRLIALNSTDEWQTLCPVKEARLKKLRAILCGSIYRTSRKAKVKDRKQIRGHQELGVGKGADYKGARGSLAPGWGTCGGMVLLSWCKSSCYLNG